MATGGMWAIAPTFCQGDALDFFEIDEKIGGGCSSKSSSKFLKMIHQY